MVVIYTLYLLIISCCNVYVDEHGLGTNSVTMEIQMMLGHSRHLINEETALICLLR